MQLSSDLYRQIHAALVEYFDYNELARLVRYNFDGVRLDGIADGQTNVPDAADKLLAYCEKHDQVELLLNGASEQRPNSRPIQACVTAYRDAYPTELPPKPQARQRLANTRRTFDNKTYLIDRLTAVDIFEQMLDGKLGCCVLSVEGAADMGKSRLLKEYFRRASGRKLNGALVPLENHYTDAAEVLHELVKQLGRQAFPTYWERHLALSQQRAAKSNAEPFWLKSPTDEVKVMRSQQLTHAFVQDVTQLAQRQPLILLLDAIEQAIEPVRNWLHGDLLQDLIDTDGVWVVLAGRTLPPPDFRWEQHVYPYELPPVEVHDFQSYCDQMQLNLTPANVKLLHTAFDGMPGKFVKVAPKFMPQGGGA